MVQGERRLIRRARKKKLMSLPQGESEAPGLSSSATASVGAPNEVSLFLIREQGSFAVGGTVIRRDGAYNSQRPTPEGQTLHGDHARVFFQVPVNARRLPIVFWHGNGQFSKTWETTPDGREGFQNLFLRRGFGVYVVDQPRRGGAGQSTQPWTIEATPSDQATFEMFRVGRWPHFFQGVQFAQDHESLNQLFRQSTPNTGPFDLDLVADAGAALFARIGEGILVTHSQGGGPGWRIAIESANVRAIVSFEPGSNFMFPEGEVPPPMPSSFVPLEALGVPMPEFMAFTRIPIVIYYGDNIPTLPSPNPGEDAWRVRLEMARLWRDTVNRHGGDVTVVHLPEIGITGNTHFPFSDLNNIEIADLMSSFLSEKGLD